MRKNILLLAMFAAIAGKTNAIVRNVSNDPINASQSNTAFFYTTLQAAYTACSATDTLLLEGTNIPYETGTGASPWAKQIVVIGIGFNPNKTNPRHTQIRGTAATNFIFNPLGNSSKFYGIDFLLQVNSTTSGVLAINNYSFTDCLFEAKVDLSSLSVSNVNFTNCIFSGTGQNCVLPTTPAVYSGILFTSCIFNGYIDGNSTASSSLTIDHCLFLAPSTCVNNLRNSTVQNSIFMNSTNPTNTSCTTTAFYNNMSRLTTTYPPAGTGNTASGNFSSTDPLLTTYTPTALYSITQDFHLQMSSPAKTHASDGSDIGPHGSITNFSETGEVLINPIVRTVNINNSTVVPNGTLNIQINASKPTDN